MAEDENYQFNYEKLLRFLTREGGGYTFVLVDDARYIRQINESLKADLDSKRNIKAGIIFLDEKSDEPVPHQLTVAAEKYGVLLVANMYEIARDTKDGHSAITTLNFNRESIQELHCKIVFWVQQQSLAFVANFAADLYVQRALTTIHFTGVMETIAPEMPQTKEWEHFLTSENFKEIEARIATFKRRLEDAEEAGYPAKRIAEEIVLPLADDYAKLQKNREAKVLLNKYLMFVDSSDTTVLEKIASVYYNMHDVSEELSIRRQIVGISKSYLNSEPDRLSSKEKLSASLQMLGEAYVEIGKMKDAENCFIEATQLAEELYKTNRLLNSFKSNLASCYSKLGAAYETMSRLEEAQFYFKKELSIMEDLLMTNPKSAVIQNDISITHSKIGDIYLAQGNFEKALDCFLKKAELIEKLYNVNPQSLHIKNNMAAAYERIGIIYHSQGRSNEALSFFMKKTELSNELYKTEPHSELFKKNLAISYQWLGHVYMEQQMNEQALEYYKKDLSLSEELHQANPYSASIIHGLALTNARIGSILKKLGKIKEAKSMFEKAEIMWESLIGSGNQMPEYERNLNIVKKDLHELQSS